MAVARVAGRHHAIEHVHAARDRFDQVLRPAHAHQVAGAVFWQLRACVFEHCVAFGLGLTDRQATDRIAVKTNRFQSLRRLGPQVVVHTALDDAEQRRVVAFMRTLAAFGPA